MTKAQVLAMTRPDQLFSFENYKQEFHKLSKANHPDVGGNSEVFAKIVELYHKASELVEAGVWGSILK